MLNLSGLLPLWQQLNLYQDLLAGLRRASSTTASAPPPVAEISPARDAEGFCRFSVDLRKTARAYFVAALAVDLSAPVILLTSQPEDAYTWYRQLQVWLPPDVPLYHFPARRRLPFEREATDRSLAEQRLSALTALSHAGRAGPAVGPIVVASARATLQKTVPATMLRQSTHTYHAGQTVALHKLLALWHALGYQPASMVIEPGTFSHRGGILDVFPPGDKEPVRIEFFGDQIETIRRFDPVTQRSTSACEAVTVPVAREALPGQGPIARARLASHVTETLSPPAQDLWLRDMERLEQKESFPELDMYLPYLYPSPSFLLDYVPDNAVVLVDDRTAIQNSVREVEEANLKLGKEAEIRGELPPGFASDQGTWGDLLDSLGRRNVCCLGQDDPPADRAWRKLFQAGPRYAGRIDDVLATCQQAGGRHRRLVVTRQAERLAELLGREGASVAPVTEVRHLPPPGSLTIVQGSLPEGWECPAEGGFPPLHLLTDAEIFGWAPAVSRRPVRPRRKPQRDTFFSSLRRGDYVVHLEHGVGVFGGLIQRTFNDVEREYLLIEYAAGDKLYVPVHQADRVSRYVGPGGQPRTIHRLGTADWGKIKRRAKKAVAEIARDLLDLYSRREVATGWSSPPDTAWQFELEASFPYDETPDQMRAIKAVKRDMESTRPMDRLICGDAGYGKTEVALRAAFKAVMGGKQVAMLVPTTVLAQQHFNTFVKRLAPFPVEVEMLSRFRQPAEQRRILERLAAGQIDIVVGTHRVLSNDVHFANLGLLIIDEEQRFGVTHKERLKKLRTKIDVLSLTATPIPRTLYMALSGIRDMSTIDTPPEQRLPVVTETIPYDQNLIQRAIRKEMARGGQTFFVHNRVMSIEAMANNLRELVPEAQMAIAHGQMPEAKLEKVMLEFAAGAYDVLICTSIIENGLDLPNVNTIIIHRADWFGLAQLYQLRGRVGRGPNRAYAYLLHPAMRTLREPARQRIEAIREATELGAGFRLAMRDLEIRGAGELLGAQQHGHIAAVGFGLYTRLLTQAVSELKAKQEGRPLAKKDSLVGIRVDLPIAAYLPSDYVADSLLRLRLYQRLGEVTRPEQVEALAEEWADRFGPLPEPARNLLFILELRAQAARTPVLNIGTEKGQIVVTLSNLRITRQLRAEETLRNRVRLGRREVFIPVDGAEKWRSTLQQLIRLL
ncbi:MAG: transcription-repair coupling factor [Chloroflexi bacterium]|nr:transcription-repair coupling factor [Chloroflexota bacterium]